MRLVPIRFFCAVLCCAALPAQNDILERGMDLLADGKIAQSIADFDRVAEMRPDAVPHLWQRGIAYYYAERFEDGRKQFEIHRTVNPNDVENAAWWYICMARLGRRDEAQKKLIPVGEDTRIPMMQVYELYAGRATVDDVLRAVDRGNPSGVEKRNRLFFGHLYLALYAEASGDTRSARRHLDEALRQNAGGYMRRIASLHRKLLK